MSKQTPTSREVDEMLRFLAKLEGKEITILPPVLVGERLDEEHDVQDDEASSRGERIE